MLKVTLINPPQSTDYPQPPIGLALLAAVLEQEGYHATILDANALGLQPKDVPPLVTDADIIGLTAMTPTVGAAISIAHHLKHANPKPTIILGGVHATLLPEKTLAKAPEIVAATIPNILSRPDSCMYLSSFSIIHPPITE